ncbi:MAG: acetate--CoA ligase family protein [Burkholderiales bacterium]
MNDRARVPSRDFTRLFNPRAIAVIGASTDTSRIGGQPIPILLECGYRGGIYPVNPKYPQIGDLKCYAGIAEVPQPCDLALVAVAGRMVPDVIRQCGAAGISFATVFSAGFREVGAEGVALEAELKKAVAESGVRIIGPNCIGTMNLVDRVYCGFGVGFKDPHLKKGPVAFVSQSGGFAYSVVALADAEGMGFNYIVSAGNEVDITTLELAADFLERAEVEVLVLYLEGVADGRRLRALGARALELGKPILTWKAGNSAIGRAAAESHTASMTADYELYRATFREGGFIEVRDVHEVVDITRVFLGKRMPRGSNIGIITTSGGSAVLMADECDRHGLTLPHFADSTVKAIEEVAPKHCALGNPVDLTAQISGNDTDFNRIVELALNDANIDQMIVRYGTVQGARGAAWAADIATIVDRADKPLIVSLGRTMNTSTAAIEVFDAKRIPWVLTPTRTAVAAGALSQYAHKQRRYLAQRARAAHRCVARQALALPPDARRLSEAESKQALAAYGIPVAREAVLAPETIAALQQAPLKFPLAVKIDSPDIPHKTEADAVRLNVQTLAELKDAATAVVGNAQRYKPGAHINGVLVAEMAAGTEVIIGVVNDQFFGPVVMFGLGGVFAELLKDVTYRFAPFDVETAHEMIAEIKAAKLLTGYRGSAPLAIDALADTLARVSLLAADHADRIAEIDINPLFVNAQGVMAADALLVLRD